jgi:SAM-dependent methyltransferase
VRNGQPTCPGQTCHQIKQRASPWLCHKADEARPSRRDAVRLSLYAAWACATATSVQRLAQFPPSDFRAIVKEVYAESQSGLAAGARVLELGAGLKCASVFEDGRFPPGMDVTALDIEVPDGPRLNAAIEQASAQGYRFHFERGDAMALNAFASSSFDAVVCSLTLCSISSADAAISEVLRVLKPGGRFGFVEHVGVREGEKPLLALSQQLLDPLQQVVAHGCHLHLRQRMLNEAMWPISQQAAGVVEKAP